MKTMPTKFRNEYSDLNGYFASFRSDAGFHCKRFIELEPQLTRCGACLCVRIIDQIIDDNGFTFEKSLHQFEVFSHLAYENEKNNDNSCLIPTYDQAAKILGLAQKNIVGEYAEIVTNELLHWLIFCKNSKIENYLPRVVSCCKV